MKEFQITIGSYSKRAVSWRVKRNILSLRLVGQDGGERAQEV